MSFFLAPIIFIGLIILFASFFVVKQETAAIIERFGKFQSVRHSGLHLKIPIIDQIAKRLNLRIQQLDVIIDTKTSGQRFYKNEDLRSVSGDQDTGWRCLLSFGKS